MAVSPALSRTRQEVASREPGSVEPPWDTVRELYRILLGVTQEALNRRGLLLSEYLALAHCAVGPVPLKSITQALGVTPAATTDLVRRLARRHLIRLAPHPTDRRSRLAILTPSGQQLLCGAKDAQKKALRELGIGISLSARQGLLRGVTELRVAMAGTGQS